MFGTNTLPTLSKFLCDLGVSVVIIYPAYPRLLIAPKTSFYHQFLYSKKCVIRYVQPKSSM